MAIFPTAYHTTVGSGAVMTRVVDAIKESIIRDTPTQGAKGFNNLDANVLFIDGSYESHDNIPFFYHPLVVSVRDAYSKENKEYVFCDIRNLITTRFSDPASRGGKTVRIRNEAEYLFSVCRAALSSVWLTENPSILRDISHLPAAIFCSWISEALARRYALDAKDQILLSIVTGIYYQSLFVSDYNVIKDNEDKVVHAVIKSTRAPSEMVFDVFSKIEKIDDVKEYCRCVKQILENQRLDDFNEGILVTVVGNTWFGTNAKEVMAIALEHPPTWLTLVFFSFTERSYKNSIVAKIATRYLGRKGEDDFVKAFSSYIRQYINTEEVKQL